MKVRELIDNLKGYNPDKEFKIISSLGKEGHYISLGMDGMGTMGDNYVAINVLDVFSLMGDISRILKDISIKEECKGECSDEDKKCIDDNKKCINDNKIVDKAEKSDTESQADTTEKEINKLIKRILKLKLEQMMHEKNSKA